MVSILRLFFSKTLVDVLLQRSIISNFDVQIYANTLPISSYTVNCICCTKNLDT